MNLIDPRIAAYAEAHTEPEPPLLRALNRETHVRFDNPQMLAGPLQGAMLRWISHMIQPRRILEIGTYTGYSAICLAQGLRKNGRLDTIEINPALEETIRRYLDKAGCGGRVSLHIGAAAEIIPTLRGPFDIVYIDADKTLYAEYYDMVFDRVSEGGVIIADNVLWSGRVLASKPADRNTRAIMRYNKKIRRDKRVEAVLLPVRDGLLIARKKPVGMTPR